MFTKVAEFIEQLNTLQGICARNQILTELFNVDELSRERNKPIFYKAFASIKDNGITFIRNLFIDNTVDNQILYVYNISEQKFQSFNTVKDTNIYQGFINEYNNSFEKFKKYWQHYKQSMIIDFVEHFIFTVRQLVNYGNQEYYNTIKNICYKLESTDQNSVYKKFFGNRQLYLPVLFYIANVGRYILDSEQIIARYVYKIELKIDLRQRVVIKLNSKLPVSEKLKFEKLVDILASKKIIDEDAKTYLIERLDSRPLFNDFSIDNNIVRIRLIDYIDTKLLPYLFIVNALYCKKIFA